MEYIIIAGIVVLIIIGLINLLKSNEGRITERIGRLETNVTKEIGTFKSDMLKDLNNDFTNLKEKIEERLNLINDKVHERLDQNFEKTNKTFMNVLERLSKIDEAQKKIDNLSQDIVSLQGILTDKKSRGTFGEVNLKHILESVFGVNDNIYKMQYTFSNNTMVDCVLFAPDPLGTIAIDSKFPLENYQIMVDKEATPEARTAAEKTFKTDVKKHIDDITSKYIINGETTDQAIMFLPAEAIFAEINAYHHDLLNYAYKKHVWIVSPTTLISTLTVIQMVIKNMHRDKYAEVIHNELNALGIEFRRYKDRWDKLARSANTLNKDISDIHTTTDKIAKKFERINQADATLLEKSKKGKITN